MTNEDIDLDPRIDELADAIAARLKMRVVAEVPANVTSLVTPGESWQPVYGWASHADDVRVRMRTTFTELAVDLVWHGGEVLAGVMFSFTGGVHPEIAKAYGLPQ